MKFLSLLVPIFLCRIATGTETSGVEALLSFQNGDQLHGHYLGFAENRLKWRRDDLAGDAAFELPNLRRVILRQGRSDAPLPRLSEVTTIHGDRIPGEILSLDETTVVIESGVAGRLEIPKNQVQILAPRPHGSISYQGPFSPDDWRFIEKSDVVSGDANDATTPNQGWIHSGAAWYWPGSTLAQGLVLDRELPASTRIRYQISWKSRMSLAVAFHADFKSIPQQEVQENEPAPPRRRFHISDSNLYAELFGNSYILQLNPTHALMYRSVVDAAGVCRVERMHTSFNNVNLGESGVANVEIRASRITGEIALFINDEFVAQWSEIGGLDGADGPSHAYVGGGSGLGFFTQSSNAAVRISDVLVSDWNGMPDAAKSMQTEEHDVILLNNGTDRFSGKIESIQEGRVSISARYGAFDVPLDDVAEMRFARKSLAKPETPASGSIRVRTLPVGTLTGKPISGDAAHIRIDHPSCGIINIDLNPAIMIELQLGESFLDAWDPNF